MPASIQHLTDIDLLKISGRDATAFLQSLLSNDVRDLHTTHLAQWTALLTAQGRVIALMALIFCSDREYLLAVPKRRGEAIRQTLQRFVLRRQVALSSASGSALIGTLDGDASAPGAALSLRFRSGRRWVLATAAEAGNFPPAGDDWKRRDLEDGLAFLDADVSDKFLAAAIGLHHLPAISLGKGCYPGQEIVTRSHYLGKAKRQLALLGCATGDAAVPAVGTPLHDVDGKHVGDVVDAVAGSGAITLLASLTEAGLCGKLMLPGIAGIGPLAELRHLVAQT